MRENFRFFEFLELFKNFREGLTNYFFKIELDNIIPVNPPIENIKINPIDHKVKIDIFLFPFKVIIQLKILILEGIAIIIAAVIK